MKENVFCSVEEAIKEFRKGNFLIVVDDKKRENEGDLVLAAEKCNAKKINFMAKYARGLICVPISEQIAKKFNLNLMSNENDAFGTAFTISIDAKNTSTGISAFDRAKTIKALLKKNGKPSDFFRPGHIFPLIAKKGGVLERAGHTEAAIDLAKLSNLKEAAVICEIMKENGRMARLPYLIDFAKKHKIKIISITDLIKFRLKNETLIEKIAEAKLPTKYGLFKAIVFNDKLHNNEFFALVKGKIEGKKNVLVRVHSACLTADVFKSKRCDCGEQLEIALKKINEAKNGVLLYITNHEGRGIGLTNKIKAYHLQENGLDTVQANKALGFEADLRDYGLGAQILKALGLTTIKLLTNNPKKIVALEGYGLKITKRIPLIIKPNKYNKKYLQTKKKKLKHLL